VGKTTLLLAYITHGFVTDYTPTVFDNLSAIEEVDGQTVNAILWDLAGQDDYTSVRTTCMKAVVYDALLLCFSVTHRDSFANVKYKWLPELQKAAGTDTAASIPVILVGCKTDQRVAGNEMHIAAAEGERRAKEIGARKYLECTAKDPATVRACILQAISVALHQKPRSSM